MREYLANVKESQTDYNKEVGQQLETGNPFAQGSVSEQDLTRFRDAFNRDGERSALQRLAKALGGECLSAKTGLMADGTEDLLGLDKDIVRKKALDELISEDEGDMNANAVLQTGTPLAEANTAQVNPIIFPLPVREVRQLAQKIVDALLIHEAALNDKQEITIRLKDCLLDGADVSIFRDGGVLRIAFSSLTADMATTVRLNQNTLREALLEKMDIKEIKISTSLREEGDANHGRSRGYTGFLSDNDEDEETDSMGRRVRRHVRVARKSTAGNA
jgi:hypothetical protein